MTEVPRLFEFAANHVSYSCCFTSYVICEAYSLFSSFMCLCHFLSSVTAAVSTQSASRLEDSLDFHTSAVPFLIFQLCSSSVGEHFLNLVTNISYKLSSAVFH